MNRHLHRVVFNAARGLRMVVAETGVRTGGAGSTGDTGSTGTRDTGSAGSTNTCRTDPRTPWWRPTAAPSALSALSARPNLLGLVGLAALALLPAHSAQAQIVANPFAPGSQRPQVLVAPNGTPLINITAPSAAGVSVNGYSRFDVHGIGAILNNSRHPTQTQLGGIVGGNPWLLGGAARLIVNQIASEHPSHLNGPIEVAGQRAEVVIANPAGISIQGGGFINSARVTLTTGVPQLDAFGGLQGYTVRDGTITVGKGGLDASRTDYAAILARAVELNDAIWANHLKVVTGANEVSGDHAQITPIQGTGTRPKFALDVAALGGMYSGSIFLTGTEHGLGVRHAGHIGAGPGGFVVTADGWLLNLGEIQSGGDVTVQAQGVANSGRIQAAQSLQVASVGTLANTLDGQGGTLEAPHLVLSSRSGDRVAGALGAKQVHDGLGALNGGGAPLSYGVSVNASRNTSQSHSFSTETQAVGSSVVGANNVNIVATGGGDASNIRAVGSTIAAGNTVNLSADNDILLEASRSEFASAGHSSSNGANVGVTFGAGTQNGFSIQLGVNSGQGRNNQNETTHTFTQVSGGEAVNIVSGGDLTLHGATVEAHRVTADVGGDLTIGLATGVGAGLGGAEGAAAGLNEAANNAVAAVPLIAEALAAAGEAAVLTCVRSPKCVALIGTAALNAALPSGENEEADASPNPDGDSTPAGVNGADTYGTPPNGAGGPDDDQNRNSSVHLNFSRVEHHSGSRLRAKGISTQEAEIAVREDVERRISDGSFQLHKGHSTLYRTTVNGIEIEYRLFLRPNGEINVGTIFPAR